MTTVSQPTSKTLNANGLRLQYLEWGDPGALPIICVHGYTSSAQAFNALARRLSDRAHILALGVAKSAFYNLGTGGGSSVRQVIEVVRTVTGKNIPVIEKPRRPGDPPRLIASSRKIKQELGWDPKFQSLEPIIESAWKWHQKFPNGYED